MLLCCIFLILDLKYLFDTLNHHQKHLFLVFYLKNKSLNINLKIRHINFVLINPIIEIILSS